ncbi:insulin receptor substrate 1-like [Mizuhopecten yessoensis]|uniref:Insulin receptor substrate 1 n=1 Tax=Mizuhopecten yessoensis TaxID=6573 RepID=A0A210PUH8_MIZYE|nr:insulin receptor substrate 1-like [Mizuhopecten yessoensis]OWF40143.1 Insulin receptor substrate 1-B [Mizuhopecten yessoensis]
MDSASRMTLVFERPGSDIKKAGYLKKLKTMKKKFFLMRSTSSSGPARFEYYDSEKKFRNGQAPKRVVHLHTCFNINKKSDTRTKNAIALYTRDDCFAVIADTAMEQDHWLELLLEYQTEYSDGVTVTPRIHFDYVWQVTIKHRGLGCTIPGMSGTYRMCLSTTDICLFRNNSDLFEFNFQLSSIRRCGHSDGYFFMDVGRSAPTGEGELWIQVDDTVIAQSMHEVILSAMRTSSNNEQAHFRPRSSTNTSMINRPRDNSHDLNGTAALRPRTGSEGQRVKGQGSPSRRPMSSVVYRSPNTSMDNTPPVAAGQNSFHPHLFEAAGQPAFYENQNAAHATLNFPAPGHRGRSDSAESRGSRCSQVALSPDASMYGSSPGDQLSHRSMTPESMRPTITEESAYFDMSPGAGARSTTPSPPHPFTTDRIASDAIMITGSSKHEGYIEMKPSSSLGSSVGGNDTGYMDMAINSPGLPQDKGVSDNSYMMMGHHGNRQSSMSVPIPSRVTKEGGYVDMNMTPTSQPLPTVKEGGSGESYLPMTPTGMSPRSAADLKPAKVISYLSDDSMSGEFPKRAYSLGSRPVSKTLHRHTHIPEPSIPLDLKVMDNGRSSSAPHLIVQKIKNQAAAYMPMDASSYSASIKSDDSDSFMELDFCRPRTASESYGYRPRASSFGKMYNTQGHRPRSSSYGQSSRGGKQMGSFESVRTTSKELLHKRSFESLSRFSTTSSKASSSESLRKLETSSKSSQQSDYVDMNMNRNSENSGYIDMSIGGQGQSAGSKCSGTSRSSSSQSLSSSPAVSGFISPSRPEKSSPDIKIIKASGHVVQKPVGFIPSHHTGSSTHGTDGIPSQAALFSPVAFNSGSGGSRSPSVKGRSPASSGRESEEESYVPYQPASSDKNDSNFKGSSGKDSSSSDSGKFSLKKKKHKSDKSEKKSAEKHKKGSSDSKKFGKNSPKDGKHSPKSESKYQKTTSVQDDVYLAYEPGSETLSEGSDRPAETANVLKKPESVPSYTIKSAETHSTPCSDYMDFQPEVSQDTSVRKNTQSDVSRKVKDSSEKSPESKTPQSSGKITPEGILPVQNLSTKSEQAEPVVFSLGSMDDYMTHTPASSGEDRQQSLEPSLTSQEHEKTPTNPGGPAGESYLYMEFDPSAHRVEESAVDVKNPTRVRSYIAEKSMETDLAEDSSNPTSAKNPTVPNPPVKTGITGKVSNGSDISGPESNKIIQKSRKVVEQPTPPKLAEKKANIDNSKGNLAEKHKRDSPKALSGKLGKSKEKPAERRLEIKSLAASVLPVHEEEEDDGYVGLDFSKPRKSKEDLIEETAPSDLDSLRPLPVRSEICGLEGSFSKVVIKRLVSLPGGESDDVTDRQPLCRKISAPSVGQYNQKIVSDVRMSPVRKGSVSSLGEESNNGKREDGSCESVEGQASGATGAGQSSACSELHKQKSMPCMTLPVADEAPAPSVAIGTAGFFNNPRSRHSCSDLTGAYEQMTYPSGNDLASTQQQSSSQQQLAPPACAQLNYASLDLGSSETVDSNDPKSPRIKSRHSSADEQSAGPTLSYAQIDFKKSENLKSASNKDVLFSFD